MVRERIDAAAGRIPFDLLIRNVRIVNCFDASIRPGAVGVTGDTITYTGPDAELPARETADGRGAYLLPGFVDAHMHLESSMLSPVWFGRVAASCGTTTVAADPHEICNVLGVPGVRALRDLAVDSCIRVLMMAPSTVPSAPGLEGSGAAIGYDETLEMLKSGLFAGLGEVMDFNGVANGTDPICSVLEAAAQTDLLKDGHVSLLSGRRLMAFRAAGIDSDHTTRTIEAFREELAMGFCVQVQEMCLREDIVREMNTCPVADRVCLVTDDVPLPRLMRSGHLNHVVNTAIRLGLDPMRAIRYATINPAQRLRLYDVGGIAPGMKADLQLVRDLRDIRPEAVWASGRQVFPAEDAPLPDCSSVFARMSNTLRLAKPIGPDDFRIPMPRDTRAGDTAIVNLIRQDGHTSRTAHVTARLPVIDMDGTAQPDTEGLCKMCVFNRYGIDRHGIALIEGLPGFRGAAALTYGHDSHNLTVYGTDDADMLLAASTVAEMGGGLCAVSGGAVCSAVPLPLAGLMSPEPPEALHAALDDFLNALSGMGFRHENPMLFLTLMPLAVSPEIKCTDMGLIDVVHKQPIPLIERIEKGGRPA